MVKKIPGARYKIDWTLPLSWVACVQARDVFGELLTVGPALVEWATAVHVRRGEILQLKNGEIVYGLDDREYDFQRIGSSWLYGVGRGILADEPRTGKTIQMLAALRALGQTALPALVIAPNGVKQVWADEAAIWYPEARVEVLYGTAVQRRKQLEYGADIVVTNWENIRTMSRLEPYGSIELSEKEKKEGPLNQIEWATVIADEAHRGADHSAKQTRAWWFLSHSATYRYALTGTPVKNRPGDLWSIWYAISPEEVGNRTQWTDRYCVSGQGTYGWEIFGLKPDKAAEFHTLLDPRFLRRTKAEVDSQRGPDRAPQIRWVMLEGKQATTYRTMEKDLIIAEETGIMAVSTPLERDIRLLQIANGSPVMDGDQLVALTKPSAKFDGLMELLENEMQGEPLVVFSPSKLMIRFVAEELTKKKISHVEITGDIEPQLRSANVARFQVGEAQVALCTTQAASEGITLNRASTLVFLGVPRSLVEFKQAKERTEAVGKPPSDVIIILAAGTKDVKALDDLGEKQGYAEEVNRDGERTTDY